MADVKITGLTAAPALAAGDLVEVVDVSDTSGGASGTSRKATLSQILDVNHDHVATDITDFDEAVDDRVSTTLEFDGGITAEYDDVTDTLTISGAVVSVAAPVGNVTTDGDAYAAAFSAVAAGGTVMFPLTGTYKIGYKPVTPPDDITIRWNGCTIITDSSVTGAPDGYQSGPRFTGSRDAGTTVTSTTTAGALTCTTAANALGLAAGDLVAMVSDKLFSPPRDQHLTGEYRTIRSITGTGPYTYTFWEAALFAYASSDTPKLYKMTCPKNLRSIGGNFQVEDDLAGFGATRPVGIIFKYIDGVTIEGMKIDGKDIARQGVIIRHCLNVKADIVADNCADTNRGASAAEGYGVAIWATYNCDTRFRGNNNRHPLDVGGFGTEPPADMITIDQITGKSWASGGSTHGGANRVVYRRLSAHSCGGGALFRNRRITLDEFDCVGVHRELDALGVNQSSQHALQTGETSNYVQSTLTFKAVTGNIATLTTSAAHGYDAGAKVTVASSDATFNGNFVILSTPTTTTFTYALTHANVAPTAVTGTADGDDFGAPGGSNINIKRVTIDLTQVNGATAHGWYSKGPVDFAKIGQWKQIGGNFSGIMFAGDYTKNVHIELADFDCSTFPAGHPTIALAPGGANMWEGQTPVADNGEVFDNIVIDHLIVRNPKSAPIAVLGGTATTPAGSIIINRLTVLDYNAANGLATTDPLIRVLGGIVGRIELHNVDWIAGDRSKFISLENGATVTTRIVTDNFAASGANVDRAIAPQYDRADMHGLTAATFAPGTTNTSASPLPTSGGMVVKRLFVPPCRVTGLAISIGTGGTGTTHGLVGFYNGIAGGARLASTADQTTAWASSGVFAANVVTPFDWPGGYAYIAISAATATTMPSPHRGASGLLVNLNMAQTLPNGGITADTGLTTTLPANLGVMSYTAGNSFAWWVGVIGTAL